MKKGILSMWLPLLFTLSFWSMAEAAGTGMRYHTDNARPNIILFVVDDMGWQDTSVPFHHIKTPYNNIARTPNMERLAESGVTFTRFYTASPVCTPSRTSMMTGKHPARNNITNWTLHNDHQQQETAPDHYPLLSPEWNVGGLQPDDLTLPELLRDHGYRTIHVGKAHFGALDTPGADPLNLGFDVNIAGHAAGAPGSYYGVHNFQRTPGETSFWDVPGLEKYHGSNLNLTEVLTLEAKEAIADAVKEETPFFLNFAHYTVHTPIMADSSFIENYSGLDPVEAAYFSMIEGMDHSLGMLVDELRRLGIDENTVMIFVSDDGALSAHTRGETVLGTGLNTHNLPLRSGKGSAYEGGARVPMILSIGNRDGYSTAKQMMEFRPGSVIKTPVFSTDLFPTILEIAGADIPDNHIYDGITLLPLVNGKAGAGEERTFFWHYPHKWGPVGPGIHPFTSVKRGPWKLIYFYDTGTWELYNIEEDLSETRNLIRREPQKAAELYREMAVRMEETGAQLPVRRETGEPVPFPVFRP